MSPCLARLPRAHPGYSHAVRSAHTIKDITLDVKYIQLMFKIVRNIKAL